jgi:hypothetical protein
MFYGLSEL